MAGSLAQGTIGAETYYVVMWESLSPIFDSIFIVVQHAPTARGVVVGVLADGSRTLGMCGVDVVPPATTGWLGDGAGGRCVCRPIVATL